MVVAMLLDETRPASCMSCHLPLSLMSLTCENTVLTAMTSYRDLLRPVLGLQPPHYCNLDRDADRLYSTDILNFRARYDRGNGSESALCPSYSHDNFLFPFHLCLLCVHSICYHGTRVLRSSSGRRVCPCIYRPVVCALRKQ